MKEGDKNVQTLSVITKMTQGGGVCAAQIFVSQWVWLVLGWGRGFACILIISFFFVCFLEFFFPRFRSINILKLFDVVTDVNFYFLAVKKQKY